METVHDLVSVVEVNAVVDVVKGLSLTVAETSHEVLVISNTGGIAEVVNVRARPYEESNLVEGTSAVPYSYQYLSPCMLDFATGVDLLEHKCLYHM